MWTMIWSLCKSSSSSLFQLKISQSGAVFDGSVSGANCCKLSSESRGSDSFLVWQICFIQAFFVWVGRSSTVDRDQGLCCVRFCLEWLFKFSFLLPITFSHKLLFASICWRIMLRPVWVLFILWSNAPFFAPWSAFLMNTNPNSPPWAII